MGMLGEMKGEGRGHVSSTDHGCSSDLTHGHGTIDLYSPQEISTGVTKHWRGNHNFKGRLGDIIRGQ